MASSIPSLPVALTIAGSDSGGGAGIQADLKTFSALGAYGTSALTAITAQNPSAVTAIQPIDPEVVAAQIKAVGDYFTVGAAKTGMLFSAPVIEAVAEGFRALRDGRPGAPGQGPPPLVVDPVMVATSGAKLLNDDAIGALKERILPLATLLTPNMGEAALLSGRTVETEAHLEPAARALYDRFGVPVLVKGGHLRTAAEVVDCLYDGREARFFRDRFIPGLNSHGTGCTLSAAIAVKLLQGRPLAQAVAEGRHYLQETLARARPVGRETLLNHFFAPLPLGQG
jgi:hydroxymethylpyrimidine/phosphomethylpyrimidine kinase